MITAGAAFTPLGQVQDTREWLTVSYCRLSKDPEGKRADFAAQVRAQEAIWGMYGAPEPRPEHRFSDDDTSGSKAHVVRHGWNAMLAFLRSVDSAQYRVLVTAYSQDRLSRQLGDPKIIADVVEGKRGILHTHAQGAISTRLGGRDALYVTGAVAASEAEKIQGRTLAGIENAAREGRRHGNVCYGWRFQGEVDRFGRIVGEDVIDDDAANVIRELARRVLAGDSLRNITNDLNSRGIGAPGAGNVLRRDPLTKKPVAWAASTWTPTKVRAVLLRESNVGIRVHKVGPGQDAETRRYSASWEPILDRDVWESVCAVLKDPARRSSRSNVARHWLSGIAKCSVCGSLLTVQSTKSKKGAPKYETYRCPESHVLKAKARVDLAVETWVLAWISDPQVRAFYGREDDPDRADALTQRNALQARLDEADMRWATGELDDARHGKITQVIQEKIRELDARLRADRDQSVYADLMASPVGTIAKAWESIPLARKRAIVAALFDIKIMPSERRGRAAFDPRTIVVTPRERIG